MACARCFAPCVVLLLALFASGALASLHSLTCTDNYPARVKFLCQGSGTVNAGANATYTIAVDQESAYNQLYDVNVTLRSIAGDADLCGPLCLSGVGITVSFGSESCCACAGQSTYDGFPKRSTLTINSSCFAYLN